MLDKLNQCSSAYSAYGINAPKSSEKPTVDVAINGVTGRIGKAFFRQWAITELGAMPGIVRVSTGNLLTRAKEAPVRLNLVAVNAGKKVKAQDLEESLKHDSVFGDYPGYLKAERNDEGQLFLKVGNPDNPRMIRVLEQREIKAKFDGEGNKVAEALPWAEYGVDIAVDTTGVFKTKETLGQHLEAGAKKAIVSAPAKDDMRTIVYGINDKELQPTDKLISNASCTTTASAAIVKVLDDAFGIKNGFIQSTHSGTASQLTQDKTVPESKSSSAAKWRSVYDSIIPSTTGAAKAIGKVIPGLAGKMNGLAARVPTSDTSMIYLVMNMKDEVNVDEVKAALRKATQSGEYKDMLAPAQKNATTKDMIGRHENAIYVEDQIQVIDEKTVVVPAFYDNEWGYTRSLMDLTRKAGAQLINEEQKRVDLSA